MTDTITLPRSVIEQAIESLQGYARETGDTQPCDAEKALSAALAQQAPQVAQHAKQGWVLVPVEPTQEMINAGRTTPMPSDSEFDEDEDYRAVFIAMVAAAPKGGV